MPLARSVLLSLGPLLTWGATTALAQGERPWVDPPSSGNSPPAEAKAPAPLSEGVSPRGDKSTESRRPPEAKNRPVIHFGSRPSAAASRDQAVPRTASTRPAPAETVGRPTARTRAAQRRVTRGVIREALAAGATPRPSFNCRGARTSVERAICANPVLAAKDRRMASLYEQAGGSRRGPVDRSQWRWLAARNACARAGTPALRDCIDQVYSARIAELSRAR
jgi:hypothetical protein